MGEVINKKGAICIIISLMLFTGCIGDNNNFEIPKIVQDGWDKATGLINSTFNNITFSVDILPVINAMENAIQNLPTSTIEIRPENINLINEIAKLPTINDNVFITIDSYKQLADTVNTLIQFLNREGGFNIKILEKSTDEFTVFSNHLNRFIPLVENYNSVISSAQTYNENDQESIKEFYIAIGVLGFELALIFGHVWYKTTYNIVGSLYRASGLNVLAFKCPTLIATILRTSYWNLHNLLVDASSDLLKYMLLSLPLEILTDIGNN